MTKYNTNSITRQLMLDLIIHVKCSFELISVGAQIISADALINARFGKRKHDLIEQSEVFNEEEWPKLLRIDEELRNIRHALSDVSDSIERDTAAYLSEISKDDKDPQIEMRTNFTEKLSDYLGKLTDINKRL